MSNDEYELLDDDQDALDNRFEDDEDEEERDEDEEEEEQDDGLVEYFLGEEDD